MDPSTSHIVGKLIALVSGIAGVTDAKEIYNPTGRPKIGFLLQSTRAQAYAYHLEYDLEKTTLTLTVEGHGVTPEQVISRLNRKFWKQPVTRGGGRPWWEWTGISSNMLG